MVNKIMDLHVLPHLAFVTTIVTKYMFEARVLQSISTILNLKIHLYIYPRYMGWKDVDCEFLTIYFCINPNNDSKSCEVK
jgi:hypothetical protein